MILLAKRNGITYNRFKYTEEEKWFGKRNGHRSGLWRAV